MGETGLLAPDARVELLDGQIIDMLPIGPYHGGTVDWLNETFAAASHGRWITRVQGNLHLGPHYEPQPDLMLLRPSPNRYRIDLPTAADVFLLIEVSDSTLLLDREDKVPAYAEAGIAETWIVNVPQKLVEVFRRSDGRAYLERLIVRSGEALAPQAFPEVSIDTAQLLV